MKKSLLLFPVLAFQLMQAQTPPAIKNLVFEGAGVRGIAYCGAVQEMESKKMMDSIERVGGTSSGAIVALTISLGYSGKEIETIISNTNFKKFNDGNFFFIGGINRLNKYFGWYKGKKIEKWLEKMIKEKTGNENITFEELHQKGFKDLYITGTSLNRQKAVVFSYESYPKMKIKDAIRISISIPLYFEPVFIDSSGKTFDHPKQKQGFDMMVDGGILENFPIHMFDKQQPDPYTMGFRIDHGPQIKNDKGDRTLAEMPVNDLKQYFGAFYNIVIENLNRQLLTIADWQRTVSISDGNVLPKVRKLSKEEVSILIENGRKAVQYRF
ncbi:MAG TPA: patatin-like phospholipase family protein [Chitinophagaceae bacterium]|jgi:NTE family protein|nr:patatin-like phospholipase family protein [Chitinophagaceae bacterium]